MGKAPKYWSPKQIQAAYDNDRFLEIMAGPEPLTRQEFENLVIERPEYERFRALYDIMTCWR